MAKKSSTTENSENKKKREPAKYSEFVSKVILEKISARLPWIREVCEKYRGIEPVPVEVWKQLDEIVIDISREAKKWGENGHHYRTEPVKRATYNISHQVREMQRKDIILYWLNHWIDGDTEWSIHVCNQIWLDIAIWLSENSKVEKESKNDD